MLFLIVICGLMTLSFIVLFMTAAFWDLLFREKLPNFFPKTDNFCLHFLIAPLVAFLMSAIVLLNLIIEYVDEPTATQHYEVNDK